MPGTWSDYVEDAQRRDRTNRPAVELTFKVEEPCMTTWEPRRRLVPLSAGEEKSDAVR